MKKVLYYILRENTSEFLKIKSFESGCLKLEEDEDNPLVFSTELKSVAYKICDPSSYYETFEELVGYHIDVPLQEYWEYNKETSKMKFHRNPLVVLEVCL